MDKNIDLAVTVIVLVIGVVIAVTAMTQQAPTVAALTDTRGGSGLCNETLCTSLYNAGIRSNTLAGTVYGFYNVMWALGGFIIVVGALLAKKKGYI